MPTNNRQVTLSQEQLKEQIAKDLLVLLEKIAADGRLTDEEILRLDGWLKNVRSDKLPALTYLRGRVEGVLADRVIIEDERRTIVAAILRVLPKAESDRLRTLFNETAEHDRQERSWELKLHHEKEEATPEQKQFLRAMGRALPDNCTRAEATEIVNEAIGVGQPVTNRQLMVLRFWNRMDLSNKGKAAVSEWLDAWYAEDPDRLTAWTLWKEEFREIGREDPPERVALDLGDAYLDRVKALAPVLNMERAKSPLHVRAASCLLILVALGLLYWMLF